jgi:hypothetical protein
MIKVLEPMRDFLFFRTNEDYPLTGTFLPIFKPNRLNPDTPAIALSTISVTIRFRLQGCRWVSQRENFAHCGDFVAFTMSQRASKLSFGNGISGRGERSPISSNSFVRVPVRKQPHSNDALGSVGHK